MRYLVPALALVLSCGSERPLDAEIRVVRAEIDALESETVHEGPMWPADFEKFMDDETPDVPPSVYRHVVLKLSKMAEPEVGRQASPISIARLKDRPAEHRGKFCRITGRVSRLWIEDVSISGYPRKQVYAGILYVDDLEPVLFHSLKPPELLYVKEDVIGFDGVFVKMIAHEFAGGGRLRAPFLVAPSIRKYH